jgi:hypothetical protein
MSGSIIVRLLRSTVGDLQKLVFLLRDHPGDHEVYIQIEPKTEHPLVPIQIMCKPSEILQKEVNRLFGQNAFQIVENLEFGEPF